MMKYPSIPHDKNKSVKIKLADIPKMKHLIEVHNWSLKQIAEIYNVTQICVRYNIDPIYRRERLDMGNEYKRNRWATDNDYKKSHVIESNAWMRKRRKDSDMKKYLSLASMAFLSTEHGKKLKRVTQNRYRLRNIDSVNGELRRIGRVKSDSFFRMFWDLVEPDTRTKKEIHTSQCKRWRLENPEKQRLIDLRYYNKKKQINS